jgi:steroid delta-isomerase-like uncharacterized protein
MSEDNKAVVRRYREAYNSNNLDELDEVLAPDWVSHAWTEGIPRTIENAKELHRMTLSVFPDWRFTTHELIAEGDVVVERFTFQGTHQAELGGLPATGNRFDLGGVSIYRIADGKIVEHWAYVDELGFLEALGFRQHLGIDLPQAWRLAYHRDPLPSSNQGA